MKLQQSTSKSTQILIVGAGLNAAKQLCCVAGIEVKVIDRKNYHLFQPLLYH